MWVTERVEVTKLISSPQTTAIGCLHLDTSSSLCAQGACQCNTNLGIRTTHSLRPGLQSSHLQHNSRDSIKHLSVSIIGVVLVLANLTVSGIWDQGDRRQVVPSNMLPRQQSEPRKQADGFGDLDLIHVRPKADPGLLYPDGKLPSQSTTSRIPSPAVQTNDRSMCSTHFCPNGPNTLDQNRKLKISSKIEHSWSVLRPVVGNKAIASWLCYAPHR